MAVTITQVINGNGPVSSLSGSFTSQGGTLLMLASGSAWRLDAGLLWVNVGYQGDDEGGGAAMTVWTNEGVSHKALVPIAVQLPVGAGTYTVTLGTNATTVTDLNDTFNVTVLEFS